MTDWKSQIEYWIFFIVEAPLYVFVIYPTLVSLNPAFKDGSLHAISIIGAILLFAASYVIASEYTSGRYYVFFDD